MPEQYRQLADGRLDVGIGRAAHAPPEVASRLSATTRSASWYRPATGSPRWNAKHGHWEARITMPGNVKREPPVPMPGIAKESSTAP